MSYRSTDQSIQEPCDEIIEGIDVFITNTNNRVDDGEWADEHINDLVEISTELLKVLEPTIANFIHLFSFKFIIYH